MDERQWHYVHAKPDVYAYGYLAGNTVYEISASIERLGDGSWRWWLTSKWSMQGIEPSANLAKERAIEALQQISELDQNSDESVL
jgi:hypothetical protein